MKQFLKVNFTKEIAKSFIGLALIAASSGYLTSQYIISKEENVSLSKTYKEKVEELAKSRKENASLAAQLESERASARSLENQVGDLSNAVDVWQKYAKTDKQLLAKYSKVYFLNENYIPESLTTIDGSYLFEKNKVVQFHTKAYTHLKNLLDSAKDSGLNLLIASAYRSFGTQSALKSTYKRTFGTTAANSFSADQGYSEHQLGTAVDLTTPSTGGALTGFEKTKEYDWLKSNAYKYGFIISYPSTNKYYIFEPWHWRFVGVKLATELHDKNIYFYDMNQRNIDEYFVPLFD